VKPSNHAHEHHPVSFIKVKILENVKKVEIYIEKKHKTKHRTLLQRVCNTCRCHQYNQLQSIHYPYKMHRCSQPNPWAQLYKQPVLKHDVSLLSQFGF
jgi:hypothetical protein